MRLSMTGLLASAMLSLSVPAHAADNLECMASGYSAAEQAQFDGLIASFDHRQAGAAMAAIEPALVARMTACAAQHGWSEPASRAAIEYRRADLIREGLRRHSPASPEGLAAMDASIAAADPEELRGVIEAISGGGGAMNTRSLAILLPIVQASGLPMDRASGQFAGAWIAATFALQDRRRLFATS